MKYPVVEVFESIQGEGTHSGRIATFIRFAGCNLRCPWCDTKDSLALDNKTIYSIEEVMRIINKISSGNFIVLTGGEPALHNLQPLVIALHDKGYYVAIETNGTLEINAAIDWVTVSPKPPGYLIHDSVLLRTCELKFVVDDLLNIDIVRKCSKLVGEKIPVILQPESCRNEMIIKIIEWIKKEPGWRLGVQLHKYLGIK